MDGKIVIGWDGSDRGRDALDLGLRLAAATGAKLLVANVYLYAPLATAVPPGEFESRLIADAEAALASARAAVGTADAEFLTLAGSSPAQTLHEFAEREEANLILVGSSHRSALGRVAAGTAANALFHGAPCAVGVAPRGHRVTSAPITTIGVGYDGSPEAAEAVAAGRRLGRALGAAVRLIDVVDDVTLRYTGYGYDGNLDAVRDVVRQELSEVEASDPSLTGEIREGDPADELIAASAGLGLLVLGSRGYGPIRSVLLGGVTTRVLRKARCPVIVIPRGVSAAPLEATEAAREHASPAAS
jgi:nucleotide-binding universal stress UspA family protein